MRLRESFLHLLVISAVPAVTAGGLEACASSVEGALADASTASQAGEETGTASESSIPDTGASIPDTGANVPDGGGAPQDASLDDANGASFADGANGDASVGEGSAPEDGPSMAPDGGGSVLLVVGTDPVPIPDTSMSATLTAMGLQVQVFNTSMTPLTPQSAAGKQLVVIDPNTPRGNVPASFAAVPVPIIVSKDGPTDTLMMSTASGSTDPAQTAIDILAAGDPLAAGFPMGPVTVYPQGNRVIFSTPSAAAKPVAATSVSPNQIAIYYYAAGATMMNGFKAPAKRVGFFWHRTSDVTADGKKLFTAAVRWALQP
jgi:hypothetical protein